jgi:hypothetical protein
VRASDLPSPADLAALAQPYDGKVIRVVEAQHRIATNRLAANARDQQLLEALADEVKPSLPEAARALPWLLAAPLRYGYGRPSRFRSAETWRGILYAAEDVDTAVTEAAWWRLFAFTRSPGFQRPRTPTPMSAFSVRVRTSVALDLTRGPLASPTHWTDPLDYGATQALGSVARNAAIAAIRAPSARRASGVNVAVLDPAALVPLPRPHSSWAFLADGDTMLATREMSPEVIRVGAVTG